MKTWMPLALLGALSACFAAEERPRAASTEAIGSAEMAADGTVTMRLIARGEGGVVGHGAYVYPPSHPRYAEILKHLGGLAPGETKPVPPWRD